jgi:hypothetical protein
MVGMKWLSMSFEDTRLPRHFGHGFRLNFTISFTALLSWKGPLLGYILMIKDKYKYLWQTVRLSSIVFLWKNWCKATFHEEPSPISLGELKHFK